MVPPTCPSPEVEQLKRLLADPSVPEADKATAWRVHSWSLADVRYLFGRNRDRNIFKVCMRGDLFKMLPWPAMWDGDLMVVFGDAQIPKAAKESAAQHVCWETVDWARLGVAALVLLSYSPAAAKSAVAQQIGCLSIDCSALKDGELMAILANEELLPPDWSREAFEEILKRHYQPTWEQLQKTINRALGKGKNASERAKATAKAAMQQEDAVQQIFADLKSKAKTFDFAEGLKPWLNASIRHRLNTTIRRGQREMPADPTGPLLTGKPDQGQSQTSNLDLEALPENLRMLIALRKQGWTNPEIASQTGITVAQLSRKLREAYDVLREREHQRPPASRRGRPKARHTTAKALLKGLSLEDIQQLIDKLPDKLRSVVEPLLPKKRKPVSQAPLRTEEEIRELLADLVPLLEEIALMRVPESNDQRKGGNDADSK